MENKVGAKFGKWRVTGVIKKTIGTFTRYFYKCVCECGTERLVDSYSVRTGKSTSCGCGANVKHGGAAKDSIYRKEYTIWEGARARCRNPNRKEYKNYGGRGITFCDRWDGEDGFANFFEDMGVCPDGKTLGRKDNDLGYSPENCRYESLREQARNKRTNRKLTYKGETRVVEDWAKQLDIPATTIHKRIRSRSKFSVDKVLSKNTLDNKTRDIKNTILTYGGESRTIGEWAEKLEVSYQLLKNRYERGDPPEKILDPNAHTPGTKPGTKYNIPQGSKLKDLSGTKFGRLTVVNTCRKTNGKQYLTYALCRCDCGKVTEVLLNNLKRGSSKSCGCLRVEELKNRIS